MELAAFGVAARADLLWFIFGIRQGNSEAPLLHLVSSSLNIQDEVCVPFLSCPQGLKACDRFCSTPL